MAHVLLASSHLEDIDGGVGADCRSIDVVIEGASRWALIHEVEVDGVSVQDLGIKTKQIERRVPVCACIA